jgi:hypothetical protein
MEAMRFQVPQFIEIEDKIFGPLTLKQFIYMAGGAGLSFLVYTLLNSLILAIIPIAIIMGASGGLAFFKVNNKPLISVVESAFKYFLGNKIYVWKKKEQTQPTTADQMTTSEAKNYASIMVPKVSDSKLKDLTWSLDVQESIYSKQSQK